VTFLDAEVWRGKVYSGGWVTASGEAAVTEPATGNELGRTGIAGPGDVAAAVSRAAAAQAAWAATPHTQRAAILRKAGEVWLANAADRFGGTANLEAFTDTRWVTARGDIAPYPF
jgi:benzaldehyde dehydrogenase (NAD)